MKKFKLVPFLDNGLGASIDFRVEIDWGFDASELMVQFVVTGAIDQLQIPSVSDTPRRRIGLWETTCVEFFLGSTGQENYWEVNLSPSGDWNVFRLDRYRENLREEPVMERLPFRVERKDDRMTIDVLLDIQTLGLCRDTIELSVTSVLEELTGDISYWAVAHAGETADFHLRKSFVISGLG